MSLDLNTAAQVFTTSTNCTDAKVASEWLRIEFAKALGYTPFPDERVFSRPLVERAIRRYCNASEFARKSVANNAAIR